MADHPSFFFGFEQEGANPGGNIESFDAIYYSAQVQVVIVASADGVSGSTNSSHNGVNHHLHP